MRAKIFSLNFLCIFIGGFCWVHAGDSEADKVFQALKPLVGQSFKADFPQGGMSDEHIYSAVFDGKFIRDVHYVRNQEGKVVYEGETIFARDPENDTVVWWYWNSTGGYLTGTVVLEDGKLLVVGDNHGPENQTQKVRSYLSQIQAKGYQTTAYFWKDEAWVEQWTMKFQVQKSDK